MAERGTGLWMWGVHIVCRYFHEQERFALSPGRSSIYFFFRISTPFSVLLPSFPLITNFLICPFLVHQFFYLSLRLFWASFYLTICFFIVLYGCLCCFDFLLCNLVKPSLPPSHFPSFLPFSNLSFRPVFWFSLFFFFNAVFLNFQRLTIPRLSFVSHVLFQENLMLAESGRSAIGWSDSQVESWSENYWLFFFLFLSRKIICTFYQPQVKGFSAPSHVLVFILSLALCHTYNVCICLYNMCKCIYPCLSINTTTPSENTVYIWVYMYGMIRRGALRKKKLVRSNGHRSGKRKKKNARERDFSKQRHGQDRNSPSRP